MHYLFWASKHLYEVKYYYLHFTNEKIYLKILATDQGYDAIGQHDSTAILSSVLYDPGYG